MYRKHREPDVIKGKIIKLEPQMNRIVLSVGLHEIHKIKFMDILKVETPS